MYNICIYVEFPYRNGLILTYADPQFVTFNIIFPYRNGLILTEVENNRNNRNENEISIPKRSDFNRLYLWLYRIYKSISIPKRSDFNL